MGIQIRYEKKIPEIKRRRLRQKIKTVLKDLGCDKKEISILFTDDKKIAELNKRYLKRDGPTNVMSFPIMERGILGDIVISVDTAKRETEKTGETLEEALLRLFIHGLLHLLGYDHERSEEEEKKMQKEEERLLSLVKEE